MKNTFKINLPHKVLNPKYSKTESINRITGEKIIIRRGDEYFEPKKELIDFLNNQLSNCVDTQNQKESIENFFKERYFTLCYFLPYKDSYYGSWTIFKGKDDNVLSVENYPSGIMEDMKPNSEKFIIRTDGKIEKFEGHIYANEFIEEFKIYK